MIYIFIYIYVHSFEWGDDQDFLAVLCRHGGLHPIDGHFTLETYDDSPVETESLPFASSKQLDKIQQNVVCTKSAI